MSKPDVFIGFWKNEQNDNMKSAAKGLTQDQVDALRKLKAGDRFILFASDSENPKAPDFTMKLFNPPARETEGGL